MPHFKFYKTKMRMLNQKREFIGVAPGISTTPLSLVGQAKVRFRVTIITHLKGTLNNISAE